MDTSAIPPSTGGLSEHKLLGVLRFIDSSLHTGLRVKDLACVAGLSPFHFSREFKKSTGLTPHAYTTLRKIERAKALVREGDTPLAEIAKGLAFTTQAHFTHVFRKVVGMSPGRYRRMRESSGMASDMVARYDAGIPGRASIISPAAPR